MSNTYQKTLDWVNMIKGGKPAFREFQPGVCALRGIRVLGLGSVGPHNQVVRPEPGNGRAYFKVRLEIPPYSVAGREVSVMGILTDGHVWVRLISLPAVYDGKIEWDSAKQYICGMESPSPGRRPYFPTTGDRDIIQEAICDFLSITGT